MPRRIVRKQCFGSVCTDRAYVLLVQHGILYSLKLRSSKLWRGKTNFNLNQILSNIIVFIYQNIEYSGNWIHWSADISHCLNTPNTIINVETGNHSMGTTCAPRFRASSDLGPRFDCWINLPLVVICIFYVAKNDISFRILTRDYHSFVVYFISRYVYRI